MKNYKRNSKPRIVGMTSMLDRGMPTQMFKDTIESFHEHIDFVKFGWGTSLVSKNIGEKIAACKAHKVDYYFGGTLFERAVSDRNLGDYLSWVRNHGCQYVEISNGTMDMEPAEKAKFIRSFAGEFKVLSEVGFKDDERSASLSPRRWIELIDSDLAAGSHQVVLESRESGKGGICRPNGELRMGLLSEILESGLDLTKLFFEAPTTPLQAHFIQSIGASVNLANIGPMDIVSLETLRLGLRSDTFFDVHPVLGKSRNPTLSSC